MMHMSSVAGGALTIYIRAILQHKLYTDYSLIQYRIQDVYSTQPNTLILVILVVLTVLVLLKLGSVPAKCFVRLLSHFKFYQTNRLFRTI